MAVATSLTENVVPGLARCGTEPECGPRMVGSFASTVCRGPRKTPVSYSLTMASMLTRITPWNRNSPRRKASGARSSLPTVC